MRPKQRSFLGAWHVSEYVFDADSNFLGCVRQRRTLETLESGAIRVTQQCAPDASLADHPMAKFHGEWVFDLEKNGPRRIYIGPDVIGEGIEHAAGIMTGRGRWPRFGHDFVSFGFLSAEKRQITGGLFYNANSAGKIVTTVANIIGVAVDANESADFPELEITPIASDASPLATLVGHATLTVWRSQLAAIAAHAGSTDATIAGMLHYATKVAAIQPQPFTITDDHAQQLRRGATATTQ